MDYNIKFRAFTIGDESFINDIRNNDKIESLVGGVKRYVSINREAKWVNDIIMNDDNNNCYFAITLLNSDDIIGYTSISEIDYRNGTCFWSGIKLSPDVSGKGYGFQVALKIIKYVFEELRMVRCKGVCQEEHLVALNLMLKSGFEKEGLMRKSLFKNGRHINQWILSITDDNYLSVKQRYDL